MNNPYLYIINAIAPLQMDKLKYGRELYNSNSHKVLHVSNRYTVAGGKEMFYLKHDDLK